MTAQTAESLLGEIAQLARAAGVGEKSCAVLLRQVQLMASGYSGEVCLVLKDGGPRSYSEARHADGVSLLTLGTWGIS